MARLPTPGNDNSTWGTILNNYLSQSLASDGTLKDGIVTSSTLAPGAVTAAALGDNAVETSTLATTNTATSGQVLSYNGTTLTWTTPPTAPVTSVNSQTGAVVLTKADVGLGNVDNTSDANKPISTATQTVLDAKLTVSNNLSDVASATTARTNLGLGTSATLNVGTTAGTVAAGNDTRITTPDGGSPSTSTQTIKIRRGTAAQWASSNPILAAGEEGIETDTGIVKVGDGVTAWGALVPILINTYGPPMITPTGVSAIDTAAVQAAHDALPAAGGLIVLNKGTFDLSGGVTFTKPVWLRGQGSAAVQHISPYAVTGAGTKIVCTSATATPLTFSAHGSKISDLHVENTSGTAPSAGAGIAVTSGGGNRMRYDNVSVSGFYDCIDHAAGFEWSMTGCWVFSPVRYGMRVRNVDLTDGGDGSIVQSFFINAGSAASRIANALLRWESGGGLKINSCKFNGRPAGAGGMPTKSIDVVGVGGTSIFMLQNSSIENFRTRGIEITGSGLSYVLITGNEFSGGSGLGGDYGVAFSASTGGLVQTATVLANTFTNMANAIYVGRANNIYLGPNVFHSTVTTPLTTEVTSGLTTNLYGDPRNTTQRVVQWAQTGNVIEAWGTGSPEGVVTGAIGSTYRRTDGGAGTSFYVKESGTGNTGWVAK